MTDTELLKRADAVTKHGAVVPVAADTTQDLVFLVRDLAAALRAKPVEQPDDAGVVASLLEADKLAPRFRREGWPVAADTLLTLAGAVRGLQNAAMFKDRRASPVEPAAPADALALAVAFHECYERLAPSFGYETRPDTKAFDPASKNGKLMVAVCGQMAALLREGPALQPAAPVAYAYYLAGRLEVIAPMRDPLMTNHKCVPLYASPVQPAAPKGWKLVQELKEMCECDGQVMGGVALTAKFVHDYCTRALSAPSEQTPTVKDYLQVQVEQAPGAGEWQDIATAPKDGEVVMFCDANGNQWIDCGPGNIPHNWIDEGLPPTHWRPLPQPPRSAP